MKKVSQSKSRLQPCEAKYREIERAARSPPPLEIENEVAKSFTLMMRSKEVERFRRRRSQKRRRKAPPMERAACASIEWLIDVFRRRVSHGILARHQVPYSLAMFSGKERFSHLPANTYIFMSGFRGSRCLDKRDKEKLSEKEVKLW